jgi:hypothetical protein
MRIRPTPAASTRPVAIRKVIFPDKKVDHPTS